MGKDEKQTEKDIALFNASAGGRIKLDNIFICSKISFHKIIQNRVNVWILVGNLQHIGEGNVRHNLVVSWRFIQLLNTCTVYLYFQINENCCDLHAFQLPRISFASNAYMCDDKMELFFAH